MKSPQEMPPQMLLKFRVFNFLKVNLFECEWVHISKVNTIVKSISESSFLFPEVLKHL